MGDRLSKLNAKEIDALVKETKLSPQEIKEWYKVFRRDHPQGYLTRRNFRKMYRSMNPKGNAKDLSQKMFQVIDLNKDNKIDFREFILALSVYSRGTFIEKANWTFDRYDNDSNGYISDEEFPFATEMDLDSDGHLSLSEFIEFAKGDDMARGVLNSDMTKYGQTYDIRFI